MSLSRRSMLSAILSAPGLSLAAPRLLAQTPPTSPPLAPGATQDATAAPALDAHFPMQAPDLVREMVGASHGNLARVQALLADHPSLAKAAWDWGFGDWEDALGAASHVGNRPIAELLLANGARPTIFSAAMLGQLDVVKALVAASPGVQRVKGPHSITLLAHARAGGSASQPIVDYLTQLGGADERPVSVPLGEEETGAILGAYAASSPGGARLEVALQRGAVMFQRAGGTARGLVHLGGLVFQPVGAERVRISFERTGRDVTMTVRDRVVMLDARRVS
jgi:hypothetical protein